ncbi:MAG: response regulator transcription factor [Planctomycetota bacterium]
MDDSWKPFLDFVHPDDRARTELEVSRMLQGEHSVDFENRYRCSDGSWRWLAWSCPAPEPGSRLVYAIARDITLQKQTDEALRIRDSAFAAMRHGLLITDVRQPGNPIIYANAAFLEMTGYPLDEVLGRNCRFLQRDDRDQPPLATVRAAVREGTPCRALLRNYKRDGTLFWNELTLSPVHDGDGKLTHFVGIQNDVTDLVKASARRWKDLAVRIETLAPRQRQVMDALVAGQSIKQVANDLNISVKTAEMHRTKVLQKMQVADVVELVRSVLTNAPPGFYSE